MSAKDPEAPEVSKTPEKIYKIYRSPEPTFSQLVWIVVIIAFLTSAGNCWYTERGVLHELNGLHPNVTQVIKTTRNIVSKSVITVKEDGALRDYCLDSDILFNYTLSACK